ncbi:BA14K family protein [Rhizobium panacihumi]|uniref:BA14K family protein n=1 Tax=Rhizobium panacihumi TaxID=2008450 RepID=UPI003D79BCFF
MIGGFAAGAIIGGALAQPRQAPARRYVGGSSHVTWCYNRYRSYRAYDNTFQPYNGPRQRCYSPF